MLATTEAQKVLPTVVDRCHRFDFGRPSTEQVAEVVRRVADAEGIEIGETAAALVARHATGSFRDALGTLEQLATFADGAAIEPQDVLAVLGVADSEQLFAAVDAIAARDPAGALRAASALAASGRDPGQMLRDLETHGRELLTVQVLGEVPPELQVTPDRDARLAEQAAAVAGADAVRLLELVSAALDATANGAQARIQLELVLIKAASPELDPTVQALMSRIERLERRLGAAASVPAPAPAPRAEAAPQAEPEPAPEPESEPAPDPRPAAGAPSAGGAPAQQTPGEVPAPAFEEVVALWPAVVDIVRGTNQLLAALLARATPMSVTRGELTLGFPQDAAFFKRKAEQDENRRATADAVRNVTGSAFALRYELTADEVGPAALEPEVSDEELVRRFVEELDAREIAETDEMKAE